MKNQPRYLTKSRFKLGLECAAKLAYSGNKAYFNKLRVDPFMRALAEGGNQVGEMAKLRFGGGLDIISKVHDEALKETADALAKPNVILYEAAFLYENCFVRADVVIKEGNVLKLMEVKAKTIDGPSLENILTKKCDKVRADWKSYIYDIAFQLYVARSAWPDLEVRPSLVLVNKQAMAKINDLNQRFRISADGSVKVSGNVGKEEIGDLLCEVDVSDVIDVLLENHKKELGSFEGLIQQFAGAYVADKKIPAEIGKKCRDCEFCVPAGMETGKWKSGFTECWSGAIGDSNGNLDQPNVLEIWDYRKTDELISEGRVFLKDVKASDFKLDEGHHSPAADDGLSGDERRWEQVCRCTNGDDTPYLDLKGLEQESASWTFPLHFIDFETSTTAIPFHKGRRPYETTAFQFSHHTFHEDGAIEHTGQYLNDTPGEFPNFDFVRKLKEELVADEGTIFRYSNHENTVLCHIAEQLEKSSEPDKAELIDWIKTITKKGTGNKVQWGGERNMVDLQRLVVKYFYSPLMKGSNSIKSVLPAVLNTSKHLKDKYSKPVYGTNAIPSLNFENHTLFKIEAGMADDPYKTLPEIYDEEKLRALEESGITESSSVDGAAAMLAYVELQYPNLPEDRRQHLNQSLLKYCEIDTLAMVLIWEYWHSEMRG